MGAVGIAFLLYWHRERTKNTFVGTPVLTVKPSTDADVSSVQNIQHLLEYDVSVLNKKQQLN